MITRTTAVIPAHNEEKTVGLVVEQLISLKLLEEVIIVDSLSSDSTAVIAASAGARVVKSEGVIHVGVYQPVL